MAHTDKGILLKGRSQEFTAAELIAAMDEAGVDAAVLVPPNFEGDRNDQVLAAARDYAPRFAVMGRVSPNDKDEALPLMRGWKDNLGAFGFRISPRGGTAVDAMWTDGSIDWFWREAENLGIPLMVKAHAHGRLSALADVAKRHPQLRMAVDALGLREHDLDEAAISGVEKLGALAELPNISVKATSLPSYTTEAYPFPHHSEMLADPRRDVRCRPRVLGHGSEPTAMQLWRSAGDGDRGIRLPQREGTRTRPRRRDLELAWLGAVTSPGRR